MFLKAIFEWISDNISRGAPGWFPGELFAAILEGLLSEVSGDMPERTFGVWRVTGRFFGLIPKKRFLESWNEFLKKSLEELLHPCRICERMSGAIN